jgi:hypothetical protein
MGRCNLAGCHPTAADADPMSATRPREPAVRKEGAGKSPHYAASVRLSVAPMMDWTDTHCRVFHRLLAPSARLYSEMVHAAMRIRPVHHRGDGKTQGGRIAQFLALIQ